MQSMLPDKKKARLKLHPLLVPSIRCAIKVLSLSGIQERLCPNPTQYLTILLIMTNERRYYELTFNKKYLQIITKKYLQYVVSEGREIQLNRAQKWLHTNNPIKEDNNNNQLRTYVVFEHPATFQTLAMDPKEEAIINDLVTFSKEKEYYAKISKAWKR
nr:aaa-atpase asd, mitochondrial [Quercus suber]